MIKFKTKYDENIVKRACKYAIGQILIPLIVIAVLTFALGIANFIINQNIVVGILWIVFSIGYIPAVYFVVYLTQSNKYKSVYLKQIDKDLSLVDCCEFHNDHILLLTLAEKDGYEKELEREELKFFDFVSVKEKADEYIFTKKRSVIVIVPKSSLVEGTLDEFNELLSKKYGDLFKKYTKNAENQENLEPTQSNENNTETAINLEASEELETTSSENQEENNETQNEETADLVETKSENE